MSKTYLEQNKTQFPGGFNAVFSEPLANRYKCTLCDYALRDPLQTPCGHRVCSSCFSALENERYCILCFIMYFVVSQSLAIYRHTRSSIQTTYLNLISTTPEKKAGELPSVAETVNLFSSCFKIDVEDFKCSTSWTKPSKAFTQKSFGEP